MPPTRTSAILQSSSIDTRISPLTGTTTTSDGPTLPTINASPADHPTKGTKRKRPAPSASPAPSRQPPPPHAPANHPALYEPWILLPPRQRRDVESDGVRNVDVVVFSKNQNVKSGISRLLRCIGASAGISDRAAKDSEEAGDADLGIGRSAGGEEGVVVVSAQGEGTVKLVGIVDVVRRIAGEGRGSDGTAEEGRKWYFYTVLSSVEMPRGRQTSRGEQETSEEAAAEAADEDETEAMDIDDSAAVKETQQSVKEEMKKLPVLSVWMTRKRLVGWNDAFGEQEMVVYDAGA